MVRRNIIAVYLRVSTEEQDEASQRREIGQYLEREGVDLRRVQWFVDKSTGDNLDRPAFDELDKLIDNGAVRTVIVWKLDRLARHMMAGMNTVARWMDKQGIRFVSVTQDFDSRGTVGKMVASLLFGLAEMEQATRRERQAAGIAVAKEKGVYKGRKAGATKKGVRPSRAAQLREKGATYAEIAQSMDVSQSTVRRYLGVI